MGIIKAKRTPSDFCTIHKTPVHSPELSFKAKGILVYLMSHADSWKTRIDDLVKHSTDGEKSIRTGLAELRAAGYAKLEAVREQGKIIDWNWEISDLPLFTPAAENRQVVEKPDAENRHLAKEQKKMTSPENKGSSPDADFLQVENRHSNKKENNKKELEEQKEREREEKAAPAKSPQEEIYCEVFGEQNFRKLTILQQQQLSLLDDLAHLRKTCQWWAGNNYKPNSIGRMIERYHETKGGSKPSRPQAESTFDRNLRFLGIDPATLLL